MARADQLLGAMMLFSRSRRHDPPAMSLEGVLGPNGRLDAAAGIEVDAPDAVCVGLDGRLLYSSGSRVLVLDAWEGISRTWATFPAPVTALAAGPDGLVAVGMAGGSVEILDGNGSPVEAWTLPSGRMVSVVDCAFTSSDELLLVDSGYETTAEALSLAAWEDTARGKVVALNRSGATRLVAEGLHCPFGICLDAAGDVLVSLLERACVVDVSGRVRQSGFPGYLGRIRKSADGFVAACLSRRDPLIEFLKTETAFVAEMKQKIAPRHWIAPRMDPDFSHDFPVELGATRLFGEVKPWAPSFSYGLVIETDKDLLPITSAQSRADGRRHAICDAALWNGDLIVVSKASGEILNLGKKA